MTSSFIISSHTHTTSFTACLKLNKITHFTAKCSYEPPIPTISSFASVALMRNCSLFASTSAKTLPPRAAWAKKSTVTVGSDLLVRPTEKAKKSGSAQGDLPWLRVKQQSYLSQSEILKFVSPLIFPKISTSSSTLQLSS